MYVYVCERLTEGGEVGMRSHAASREEGQQRLGPRSLRRRGSRPTGGWLLVFWESFFYFLELSYFERKYKKRLQFNPHSAKIKQSQEKREKKRKTHRRFGFMSSMMTSSRSSPHLMFFFQNSPLRECTGPSGGPQRRALCLDAGATPPGPWVWRERGP